MSNTQFDYVEPSVSESIQKIGPASFGEELAGRALEMTAHAVTAAHAVGGVALAGEIASQLNYQSWEKVVKVAGLAILDFFDGWLSRRGRDVRRADKDKLRPLGAFLDPLADKIANDSIFTAIGIREIENGNAVYGAAILASTGVCVVRDIDSTAERIVGIMNEVDIQAGKSGKNKVVKQYGLLALAVSPFAKRKSVQATISIGMAASSVENVQSGRILRKRMRNDSQQKKLGKTA